MNRVSYCNICPKTLEEHIDFDYEVPHSVRTKLFPTDDIVPLHYADTLEILLCDNLVGEFTIENQRFSLGGKQVFIIPPNMIHSSTISRCDGTMYVVKFSFSALSEFIDIKSILAFNNWNISQLVFTCPAYDKLMQIVQVMIREDDNIYSRMRSIISIFEILEEFSDNHSSISYYAEQHKNDRLKSLITWTIMNFQKGITIDQAAKAINYSKFFFCRWFKAIAGITYITYLNRVRIAKACSLLRQGKSISETCFACGFEDISYFIQRFKKVQGCTPKNYIKNENQNRNINI